jgi:phosphate:Na+ symporter
VSGSILFVLFVTPYARLIQWISPKGAEVDVIARQIANAHTGFNLVMTLIWIPLIWLLVKIVMLIVPDGKGDKIDDANPQFLDNKLIGQPAAALQLVAKEVIHMSRLVESILQKLANATEKSKEKQMEQVKDKVAVVQGLNRQITQYLSDLFAAGVLTEEQANKTAGMLYVLSDVDRLAVLCGEMVTILKDKGGHSKKEGFSKDALKDINKSLTMIAEMYSESVTGMERGDIENVSRLTKKRQKVLELNLKMRKRHMHRVNEGNCKAELTASFNQLLYNIDRMSNSCVNIADAVMGSMDLRYFIGETQED